MPGPSLMPVGRRAARSNAQSSDGDQSRRIAQPRRPVAAGGIEPHRADAREVGVFGGAEFDPGRGERGEVERRDGRRQLVALDRDHPEVEGRERHRVAADSAAEVGDDVDTDLGETSGVQGGDPQPRRLLESRRGEQHPLGEVAELGPGARAQPCLLEHRRDEPAVVARGAQLRDHPHDVRHRIEGPDLVEQPQPLGREDPAQVSDIHSPIVVPRPAGPGSLALALNDC